MEMYLAVIKVLDHGEAITQQQIMRKAGLSLIASNDFLDFLVRLDIIEERIVGPKILYNLTEKGQRLCVYFGLEDGSIFSGTGIFRVS
jgi:predicted transcriptional regulator